MADTFLDNSTTVYSYKYLL